MKKTVLFLILAAGLLACSKEPVQQEITSAGEPLKFEINVADFKAAKTAWAEGDVIYVFFQSFSNKYLTLTRETDGTWTNTFVGELTAADLTGGLGGDYLTAVYFPVEVKVEYANLEYCFTDKETGGAVYSYYLFDKDREYEVDGSTVRATLQMEKPADVVLFHVAGIQESIDNYTFGCSLVRPMACASVGTDGSITESLLQPGARLSGIADTDGAIFAGQLTNPGVAADYVFTVADDYRIYTMYRDSRTLEAGKMYNFPALTESGWSAQNVSDLYVDLGLPSGVKWAKWNLGATKPEGYGDYFSWGEIRGFNSGKTVFSWSTYFDNPSGDGSTFTKYAKDKKKVLEPEDDAAYASLGGIFRMPTIADWEELDNNTVSNWTTQNGICGRLFTASNGNSIFLPAAGGRYSTSLYGADSYGLYWSSSLGEFRSDAGRVYFDSKGVSRDGSSRDYGLSVRPVWK